MSQYFQYQTFAQAIKAKRGDRSLRDISSEIEGVSTSTLSRLEQGKREVFPDFTSFLAICGWLGRPVTYFIGNSPKELPDEFALLVQTERHRCAIMRGEADALNLKALNLENRITRAIESHHQGSKYAMSSLLYPDAK